jgi:hypothetical protein
MRRLSTNCEADMNPWMTAKMYEHCPTQLGRKLAAKNCKIWLFIDHCAAYPKITIFLSSIKIIFLPASYNL